MCSLLASEYLVCLVLYDSLSEQAERCIGYVILSTPYYVCVGLFSCSLLYCEWLLIFTVMFVFVGFLLND